MVRKRWVCLALLLLTTACFAHVCFSEFIHLDDPLYVTNNPQVLGGLSWTNVKWAFTDSCYRVGFWVPVTWLSLQLDATLHGPTGAGGFHLTNVIWHLANVVLLFLVLQRMTGDLWRSAIAAALFAIHPLRVESVAWVTERKDVISTTFLLLTVAAYHRYAQQPSWGRYGLTALAFLLGLMAKPTLVTLPFALLLLDYWPLHRLRLGQTIPASQASTAGVPWQRLVLEKLPFLAMSVAISLTTIAISSEIGAVTANIPWSDRLRVVLFGYVAYLKYTIWPTNLAVLYPHYVPTLAETTVAALVLSAVTLGLIYRGRQHPALIVGWLWFLGTLVPNSGVVQAGPQGRADRFTYIPHLGLMIVLVWGVSELPMWRQASVVLRRTLVTLVLVILGALTWLQVCFWINSDILFNHSLSITGDNYTLQFNLSCYWLERKVFERAETHAAKAIDVEPNNANGRLAYGVLLWHNAKPEQAIEQLQRCLQQEPENPDAHYYLARSLANSQRSEETRRHLHKALEHWPAHKGSNLFLADRSGRQATAHQMLGEIALREMQPERALDHLDQALQLKPELAEGYHFFIAIALGRLGRWAEAEERLLKVVERQPAHDTSRGYLAFAYARQQKKELADREYANLLARSPSWLKNTNDFAMTLTTRAKLLDRKSAEELALQVCEATKFQDARSLDTLAATEAGAGEFAKARATARKALSLASDPELVRQLQERLRLYESDQPLRVEKD